MKEKEEVQKKLQVLEKMLKSTFLWQGRIINAIDRMQKRAQSLRQTVFKAFKEFSYWGVVVIVGIIISGVIMRAFDVPINLLEMAAAAAAADPALTVESTVSGVSLLILYVLYYLLIWPLGILNVIVAYLMEKLIQYPWHSSWQGYGGFVNNEAVIMGWNLVRDVCNLFFAVILAVIAIATTLKIEAYSWKQLLPKFILMAILINFSKSIAGLFTDMASVAMATFGSGISESVMTGVLSVFAMPSIKDTMATAGGSKEIKTTLSVGALVLSFIMVAIFNLVFLVVAVVYSITLVFRIAMLWFLIVLSPLAYLARILPQSQKYSSQWWEMFGRYVLVGPIVTFFLWLSLSMAFAPAKSSIAGGISETLENAGESPGAESAISAATEANANALKPSVLAQFIVATLLLLASLQLTKQMASEAGGVLGKVEAGAWAVGSGAMKLMPQFLQTRTGKWGKEGKDYFGGRFIKGAGAVIGTLAQPVTVLKGLTHAIGEKAKQREKAAWKATGETSQELIKRNIFDTEAKGVWGRYFGKGIRDNALTGAIANVAGYIGMAGAAPETFLDRVASAGGLKSMGKKIGQYFPVLGSAWAKRDESEAAKNKAEEEEKKENQRLTEEEKNVAINNVKNINVSVEHEENQQMFAADGTSTMGTEVDFSDANNQDAAEAMLTQLDKELDEATQLNQVDRIKELRRIIKFLEDKKKDKSIVKMKDFKDSGTGLTGVRADEFFKSFYLEASKNRQKDLEDKRKGIMDRLQATINHSSAPAPVQTSINNINNIDQFLKAVDDPKSQINFSDSKMAKGGEELKKKLEAKRDQANAAGDTSMAESYDKAAKALDKAITGDKSFSQEKFKEDILGFEGDERKQNDLFNTMITEAKGEANRQKTQEQDVIAKNIGGVKDFNYATLDGRKEKTRAAKIADLQYNKFRNKLAALEVGESFETRVKDLQMISEEYKKIQDVSDSYELLAYMERASEEKNPYLAAACARKITELGDLNILIQEHMSIDEHGKFDPNAQANGVGLENFRVKELIGKYGMTEGQSMRVMGDISNIALGQNHNNFAYKYTYKFGKRQPIPEKQRLEILSGEMRKKSPQKMLDWNRYGFGEEDAFGDFQINNYTHDILQFAGDDLSMARLWGRMNPNAKWKMSHPDVVKAMRATGKIPHSFINRLESYWNSVGRYKQEGAYVSPLERKKVSGSREDRYGE